MLSNKEKVKNILWLSNVIGRNCAEHRTEGETKTTQMQTVNCMFNYKKGEGKVRCTEENTCDRKRNQFCQRWCQEVKLFFREVHWWAADVPSELKTKRASHISCVVHVPRCGCRPSFDVQILGRFKGKLAHEILEAFFIFNSSNDACINSLSVHLSEEELDFTSNVIGCFFCCHREFSAYLAFPSPFLSLNVQLPVCARAVFVSSPSALHFAQSLPICNTITN